MKVHVGADAAAGLGNAAICTLANISGVKQAEGSLHEEDVAVGDADHRARTSDPAGCDAPGKRCKADPSKSREAIVH